MSRIKENKEALAELNKIPGIALRDEKISIPCIVGLLADISASLAVIADRMGKDDDKRTCDGCRHSIFPDGDDKCCICSNYYANQYESGEDQGESEGGEF